MYFSPSFKIKKKSNMPEKPFTCLESRLPYLPNNCVGEKTPLFALPFPIFDLVHMQVILSNFDIDEQLFTQTAFTR